MTDNENVISFPSDRIVEKRDVLQDPKVVEKMRVQNTKNFVETAVDDISMNLLRNFVDLAMKTNQPAFTKDLALLVDVMRGMIYRDFGLDHPAQKLSDKMVDLKTNRNGTLSAKIDYSKVLDIPLKTPRPISTNIKDELKDLNDTAGFFEPDGNLDD
jgi:hypothetical protein